MSKRSLELVVKLVLSPSRQEDLRGREGPFTLRREWRGDLPLKLLVVESS
jgi:hypothetical protein